MGDEKDVSMASNLFIALYALSRAIYVISSLEPQAYLCSPTLTATKPLLDWGLSILQLDHECGTQQFRQCQISSCRSHHIIHEKDFLLLFLPLHGCRGTVPFIRLVSPQLLKGLLFFQHEISPPPPRSAARFPQKL